jgi:TolB-like protein
LKNITRRRKVLKNIFHITAVLIILLTVFAGCGGTPKVTGADELDMAIRDASDYLNDNIPQGSKIVILNVQSDSAALSDYIIDELIANAVNDRLFSVVDRAQLDLIRQEQNFQWAGEVDDNAALEIGKFFGAQTIVSGRVSPMGSRYRLTIRALEVQTAQVQGQFNRNIAASLTITDLMKSGGGGTATAQAAAGGRGTPTATTPATQPAAQPATAPATPAVTYKIGDTGPAGGLIFYDKGNNSGGWRYLEAAPEDIDRIFQNYDGLNTPIRERAVGTGLRNTQDIMREAATRGGGFGWPAQAVSVYSVNGFDDWFLPSLDELNWIYGNLHMRGLGDFRNDWYCSSTTDGAWAMLIQFSNGVQDYWGGNRYAHYVRPVRRF